MVNEWPARAVVKQNRWKSALSAMPSKAAAAAPVLTVSVVIPAFRAERTLPLTLAALARQDYPADLIEVIVVDDGSDPPLALPDVRPPHTRLITSAPNGWGRSHACQSGVEASSGDVVLFLDADMVPFEDHVSAHMRIHHLLHDAAVIGHKRFVADWEGLSLEQVTSGPIAEAFGPGTWEGSTWLEEAFVATDDLERGDHKCQRYFTGASGSMSRSLLDQAGGLDTGLVLGEDTELGYRLSTAGAVFVPMIDSSSWHLGRSTAQTDDGASARWNNPFFLQRIPWRRMGNKRRSRIWQVPLVHVVLDARNCAPADVIPAVTEWLLSEEDDLTISLVGPWNRLDRGRRSVLRDPDVAWHGVEEFFRGEPRVTLVDEPPASVAPAMYRLDASAVTVPEVDALKRLLTLISQEPSYGWVRAVVPHQSAEQPLVLARTAAIARAAHAIDEGFPAADVEELVWGSRWVDGAELGMSTRVDDTPPTPSLKRRIVRWTARQAKERMG